MKCNQLKEQYRGRYGCSGLVSDRELHLSRESGKHLVNGGRFSWSGGGDRVQTVADGRARMGVTDRSTPPLSLHRGAVRDDSCVERPTSRDSKLDCGAGTVEVKYGCGGES